MPTLLMIPIGDLHPRPDNLRTDATADAAMVASVKSLGVLQPVLVTPRSEIEGGGWWLDAGHRRYDAATKAKLTEMPAYANDDVEVEGSGDHTLVMLVENMQRKDLDAIEQATGFDTLVGYGLNQREIAKRTGISQSTVQRRLKLLTLPESAQKRIRDGSLDLALADKIVTLPPLVMETAIEGGWDHYRVETAIKKAQRDKERKAVSKVATDAGLAVIPYDRVGSWSVQTDEDTGERYYWESVTFESTDDDGDTTTVEVTAKTPVEIQAALAEHGATAVVVETGRDGTMTNRLLRRVTVVADTRPEADADREAIMAKMVEAKRAQRAHFRGFINELATATHKSSDVAVLAINAILASVDYSGKKFLIEVFNIELEDDSWETFGAHLNGLNGPDKLRYVMVLIADQHSNHDQSGPLDDDDPWFAKAGYVPLPSDDEVDEPVLAAVPDLERPDDMDDANKEFVDGIAAEANA